MSYIIKEKEYIVTESQILNAVEYSLGIFLSDTDEAKKILRMIMTEVEKEVETVLEDDCDEMTEEMWGMMMV